jgi:hypothetical protein
MRKAQQHAQVPRVGRGGKDIPTQELNGESDGRFCACLKKRGVTTLGRRGHDNSEVFDHPDGHPHMVGEGHPEHHSSPHVHAMNKKGESKIFTYPGEM